MKTAEISMRASNALLKLKTGTRMTIPYVRIFTTATGWVLACFLFLNMLSDWEKALRYPAPHQYGEGILVWMTREIDHGKWPYGDILGTPSRYSCYAPLVPTLSAAVSRFVPSISEDDSSSEKNPGSAYVYAGRLVNYTNWVLAAALVGIATTATPLSRVAVGLMFLSALSLHSFFSTLRVDSTVLACQGLVLFILTRGDPRRWWFSIPLSVTLLTLTKPPAVLDIAPIALLSLALRNTKPKDFAKMVWKPALYAIIIAPATFFLLDIMSGTWMSNNILTEQLGSGSMSPEDFSHVLRETVLPRQMWPALFWATLSIGAFVPSGRLKLASIALSLLLCTALATKHGADANYYFPLIMVICATAGSYLRLAPSHATFVIAAATILALPFDSSVQHRQTERQKADVTYRVEALKTIHDQNNFLTEDPFFSVLAGRDPLTTDIFQLTISAARSEKNTRYLTDVASGAWGGRRLRALLARGTEFSLEETAVPMPAGHAYDAVWVKEISRFPPAHSPMKTSWQNIRDGYLKKGLIPAVFLLLLSLAPTRCYARPRLDRQQF